MYGHYALAASCAALSTGCLGILVPGASLPPPHGLRGGNVLVVTQDSAMQSIMGTTLDRIDHRNVARSGNKVSVVPAGARVRVNSDYEARRQLEAPNATQVDRNPWVLVTVEKSNVEAQVGWQGWIHAGTVQPDRGDSAATQPDGIAVARPSRLCPNPGAPLDECRLAIRSGTLVRVVECSRGRARVELWDDAGFYHIGYVDPSQLAATACGQGGAS